MARTYYGGKRVFDLENIRFFDFPFQTHVPGNACVIQEEKVLLLAKRLCNDGKNTIVKICANHLKPLEWAASRNLHNPALRFFVVARTLNYEKHGETINGEISKNMRQTSPRRLTNSWLSLFTSFAHEIVSRKSGICVYKIWRCAHQRNNNVFSLVVCSFLFSDFSIATFSFCRGFFFIRI